MGAFAESIASSGVFSRNNAEMMLKGVTPEIFARKPRFDTPGGGTIVDANHPAFLFGHLALYPTRAFALTGADGKHVEAPASWPDLFKAGVACHDDPHRSIYPDMQTITSQFLKSHDAAVAHIRGLDDALLAKANPNEQSRDRFPTVGALCSFLLSGHVLIHMGQISTWRRCFNLPSAMA